MGNEVLKKILATALLLLFSGNILAENLQNRLVEYEKLFTQIGEKRIGVPNGKIDKIKNPFIVTDTKVIIQEGNQTVEIKKPTYILSVTLNNKAKINKKWHRLNDKIGDFKLTSIRSDSVIIKNKHFKKELFIRKSDVSKIKFSSK